jgi:hypothetical protein
MPPTNSYQNPSYVYSPEPVTTTSFWKRKPVKISIILTIIVVIVAIILLILGQSKSPQNIAKQFANETLSGRATEAYKLTSTNFQTLSSMSSWRTDVQSIDSACSGTISLTANTISSKIAEEVIRTNSSSNGSCLLKVSLVYESSKWQVNSMSFTD